MPVVRAAEKALANDDTLNKEYLPVLGLGSFAKLATEMLLGKDSSALAENRVIIKMKHEISLLIHSSLFQKFTLIYLNKLRKYFLFVHNNYVISTSLQILYNFTFIFRLNIYTSLLLKIEIIIQNKS